MSKTLASRLRGWSLAVALAVGLSNLGCGSSKSSPGNVAGGSGLPPAGDGTPDPSLASPALALGGGSASSAGGQAQGGGSVHFVSAGAINVGPDYQPAASPTSASAPADAMILGSASLGSDVAAPGAVSISGSVDSGGTDPVRQITAGGDIFIAGTLRGADLGAARQGLTLKAPAGTVYISGTLDTSGAAGGGQSGGQLTIVAQRVIVSGKVLTAGGQGPSGGAAGSISIATTAGVYLSGEVDAFGGDAQNAQPTTGGRGADVSIQAGGDVVIAGKSGFHGGAAQSTAAGSAQGGDAGHVTIDASGSVAFTGTFDARGGAATTKGGGSPVAGAAGILKVGETTRPTAIGITVPLQLMGGNGQAVGGAGGKAQLEARGGDLRITGLVDASGGGSAAKPGAGGEIDGSPGPDGAAAGVDVAGQVVANGGSLSSGGSGDGAAGGTIKLVVLSTNGNLAVEPAGQVQTDGGGSGGMGTAGGGGLAYLFTNDGNASIHGKLLARGGGAADPGGTGGGGGFVYVFTGGAHDRQSGTLVIETDGVIDASGGAGTVGGSARNDGRAGSVATFPVVQNDEYAVEKVAVLINSDGVHGADRGWLDNRGQILARGAKANGSGGDVIFHGKRPDGNETPVPGNVLDNSGDGAGASGDFVGE